MVKNGGSIAIYLELLAKTDPPVLRRGVSKAGARKFCVPLRLVQSVWRNGQDYGGIKGVINKLVNNCGRKRIEIDPEAIKNVPLRHWRSLLEANMGPGPPSSQRIYEALVYFGSPLITSNSHIRVHSWILQDYPERTTCNHIYCFSCILHRLNVIAE